MSSKKEGLESLPPELQRVLHVLRSEMPSIDYQEYESVALYEPLIGLWGDIAQRLMAAEDWRKGRQYSWAGLHDGLTTLLTLIVSQGGELPDERQSARFRARRGLADDLNKLRSHKDSSGILDEVTLRNILSFSAESPILGESKKQEYGLPVSSRHVSVYGFSSVLPHNFPSSLESITVGDLLDVLIERLSHDEAGCWVSEIDKIGRSFLTPSKTIYTRDNQQIHFERSLASFFYRHTGSFHANWIALMLPISFPHIVSPDVDERALLERLSKAKAKGLLSD